MCLIFFCGGLGAAQVGECTVLSAGCRPLQQNSSAAGTAGLGAEAGDAAPCPCLWSILCSGGLPVYLGLATLAVSTCCTGVGMPWAHSRAARQWQAAGCALRVL